MLGKIKRLALNTARSAVARIKEVDRPGMLYADRPEEAAAFYREHGWALIPDAFSADEVEDLKESLRRAEAEGYRGDPAAIPGATKFVCDPRVVGLLRAAIGPKVVYFGDSSYSYETNPVPGACGFHKDNTDKEDPNAPDWRSPTFDIVRVGLYLNDFRAHSGGLALRDGSHKFVSVESGLPFAVPSKPGDLLIWSLRTTHSGFASRLRGAPRLFVPIPLQARLTMRGPDRTQYEPRPIFMPTHPNRITLLLTYGAPGPLLDRYIRYLLTRRFAIRTWRNSSYDAPLRRAMEAAGLEFRDLQERARQTDLEKATETHVPFAYDA